MKPTVGGWDSTSEVLCSSSLSMMGGEGEEGRGGMELHAAVRTGLTYNKSQLTGRFNTLSREQETEDIQMLVSSTPANVTLTLYGTETPSASASSSTAPKCLRAAHVHAITGVSQHCTRGNKCGLFGWCSVGAARLESHQQGSGPPPGYSSVQEVDVAGRTSPSPGQCTVRTFLVWHLFKGCWWHLQRNLNVSIRY